MDLFSIEICLNLTRPVPKRDVAPYVLKCIEIEWLQVYTDGSQLSKHQNVGGDVYSKLFSFYAPFGKCSTAFDGEVEAIRIALKQLTCHLCKIKNVVLLSDSQAAIQSISSIQDPLSKEISQCQQLLIL
ncbi:RNase H domain-containing protein [Nephila pilipes]|uniref:RNase H domain-containing protein n=1 Tax=Nephila pilipes TaxID=299642 RepID=A0A8X6TPB8_NEPPI|nr:RNase H domain-containing protein [Nephila pilipes]